MAEQAALVLASASPFRRHMLTAAGLAIEVLPADVDEKQVRARASVSDPASIAELLARRKAEAVGARLPERVVIGADQVLALEGEIFAKPSDLAAARRHLLRLRGRMHSLHTAVSLAVAGRSVWSDVGHASLTMRAFSDAFLDDYLARAGPGVCRMVGAYALEGLGVQLFERIDGDYFTILGLPLMSLLAELRRREMIAR
jgi:septum formation protein